MKLASFGVRASSLKYTSGLYLRDPIPFIDDFKQYLNFKTLPLCTVHWKYFVRLRHIV